MRSIAVLILPAFLLGVRQPTFAQEDRRAIPGCYDVEMGSWIPEIGPRSDSLEFAPPSRVFFDSALVGRGKNSWDDGYRALRVAEGALPSIHQRGGMWISQGDSVRLAWSDDIGSGVRAVVVEVPEGFAGEARTHFDYWPNQPQTAPIRLRRVSCDSPPPITELDQRQLLTSVSFSDGTRIALDLPFNPGPEWDEETDQRSNRSFVLRNPEIDLVGPVLSVEIWPASGINVHFLPTKDFEAVAQRFIAEIGEPTRRGDGTRNEERTISLSWGNRTHQNTLRGTRAQGGLWEIVLYLTARRRGE